MRAEKPNGQTETQNPVGSSELVRPDIAMRYRLRALCLAWRSNALWAFHDAEMTEDESEKFARRKEANAYEQCATNLDQACRDWPNSAVQTNSNAKDKPE